MGKELSHFDEQGGARMVDVGDKESTRRTAMARAVVEMSPETLGLLRERALPKGDALSTARIAGIMAAKRTPELIPMCHPLALSFVDVRFEVEEDKSRIAILSEARTTGPTGVEMEAMTAALTAALTLYDMCKAVQKDMVISDCKLVYKSGGKSGTYDVR